MMIRVLTFSFAVLCCLGMQAQEFFLKPVLGGNVSTLTGGKGKGKTWMGKRAFVAIDVGKEIKSRNLRDVL